MLLVLLLLACIYYYVHDGVFYLPLRCPDAGGGRCGDDVDASSRSASASGPRCCRCGTRTCSPRSDISRSCGRVRAPVFYPLSSVPPKSSALFFVNPMTPMVEMSKWGLLGSRQDSRRRAGARFDRPAGRLWRRRLLLRRVGVVVSGQALTGSPRVESRRDPSTSPRGRRERSRGVIPFNRPYLTGREFTYIQDAAAAGQLAGNGHFTKRCQSWLETADRRAPRAADAFVHRRARDGGAAARPAAGRRGDHAVVHLRLDRQRVRAARRARRCSSTSGRTR